MLTAAMKLKDAYSLYPYLQKLENHLDELVKKLVNPDNQILFLTKMKSALNPSTDVEEYYIAFNN